jgi:uncharacterized protein DUF2442
MLRIRAVTPLEGRSVLLTLSDGTDVERDLTDLLDGPVFVRIAAEDAVFRRVRAIDGTLVWPGDVDIAPETLIWDGPTPVDEATRHPETYLRPRSPSRSTR